MYVLNEDSHAYQIGDKHNAMQYNITVVQMSKYRCIFVKKETEV